MTLEEYQRRIKQNYRWNFIWMTIDNMMFFFILMGLSPYTVLPFYVRHFTQSKIIFGLVPAIFILGNTLPQPFMANFLKNRTDRKKYLMISAFVQRFGILGFLLLSVLTPSLHLSNTVTILIFFAMLALQNIASGFYIPTWIDFLGKTIPENRGMLFGISNFLGGLLGIGIGWLLTYLLEQFPFDQAMQVIFGITFVASMVSFVAILSWRETIPPLNHYGFEQKKKNHLIIAIRDANFARYLIWRCLLVILEIAISFYALAALDVLEISVAQVGVFTLVLALSETILNPLWGWLGDKNGFLKITLIATIAGSLAALFAASAKSIGTYYLVFFLAGAMLSGLQISNFNIIYEFSPANMVPAYLAVSQFALSPLSGVMPFIGGAIAERFGYAKNFRIAGLAGMVIFLGMLFMVKDPKLKMRP
ncbi:MAG TPA: MFS transporter [Anaerolineae bacterium]|nr:MFS transporter [Anaerolineae bacterium]